MNSVNFSGWEGGGAVALAPALTDLLMGRNCLRISEGRVPLKIIGPVGVKRHAFVLQL